MSLFVIGIRIGYVREKKRRNESIIYSSLNCGESGKGQEIRCGEGMPVPIGATLSLLFYLQRIRLWEKRVAESQIQESIKLMTFQIWIVGGDIILLSLREFQDGIADVIHKYTADEARNLKTYGELKADFQVNDADAGGKYHSPPSYFPVPKATILFLWKYVLLFVMTCLLIYFRRRIIR